MDAEARGAAEAAAAAGGAASGSSEAGGIASPLPIERVSVEAVPSRCSAAVALTV